jgi:ergothioneine biosynthesis protein EgtB
MSAAPTRYARIRSETEALVRGLTPEDCMVQAMPDVSPPKWHLAHTSWFFETFVLERELTGYRSPSPVYRELFNSYYEAVGPRHPRPERGHLSRPTLNEVLAYRQQVDAAMLRLLAERGSTPLIELGLQHEQQHQELLVMDVKYNFSRNPLQPAYATPPLAPCPVAAPLEFRRFEGGLVHAGVSSGGAAFTFDNERPAHRRFLEPFELGTRLVTNAELLEFVLAGGYQTPSLWLSDGWAWLRANAVEAPLYWRRDQHGVFHEFTAHGEVLLDPHAPVCHVSGYEAAAFAAWAGARLPTEFEWEHAAGQAEPDAGAGETVRWHPRSTIRGGLTQLFGEVWQWTRSAYEPYPGFAPEPGEVGEYNGKFMSGQWVLRGGSVATPAGHTRRSYRNFFYPQQRWPFTGIRLAREAR